MLPALRVIFDPPLVPGRLVRRYKRFFADVRLDDGRTVVTHCPNTGAMTGCARPGCRVLVQPAAGRHRRLAWTWKLARAGRRWIHVDPTAATALVVEALERGVLPALSGYDRLLREVPLGESRIDLLLSRGGRPAAGSRLFRGDERAYVEVKAVTLAAAPDAGPPTALFPDAVSERGRRHLGELSRAVRAGHRAAMVYCVQRADCEFFAPADDVDPAYGAALRRAAGAGVEIYALAGTVGRRRVVLTRRLAVRL